MMDYLKHHGAPMATGLLSVVAANFLEPFIHQDELAILVVTILMTLGIILWVSLSSPLIGVICSVIALDFYFYRHSCFVRQITLTFLIAGLTMTFWHLYCDHQSKNKNKSNSNKER